MYLWFQGIETSDPDNGRQCPFYDELHAVFTERANMQHMLMESEAGGAQGKKKTKRMSGERSDDEISEDDDEDGEDSEEDRLVKSRKRKAERDGRRATNTDKPRAQNIQGILQDFLLQQQKMEMQWREMMDRRAQERRILEQEWRQTMENLERERLMMEQAWREREEQRRIREESRAEKRDALITTLLNKLLREDL